ncbi:MAG: 50S ribosomal protein L18, partial [Dehalococcoidia bacterium]
MKAKETARAARLRRHTRVRRRLGGTPQRPRLCVFRSLNHIYAQVIDDEAGHTLVAASDLDGGVRSQTDSKTKTEVAALVGDMVGRRAIAKGVQAVVFDRGG